MKQTLNILTIILMSLTVNSYGEPIEYPVIPGIGIGPALVGKSAPTDMPFHLQDPLIVEDNLVGFSVNTSGTVALNGVMVGDTIYKTLHTVWEICKGEKPIRMEGEYYGADTHAIWAWFIDCGLGTRFVTAGDDSMLQAWAVYAKGDKRYQDFIQKLITNTISIPPPPSLKGRQRDLLFSATCNGYRVESYAYRTPAELVSGDFTVRIDEIDGKPFITALFEPGRGGALRGLWFDIDQDGKPDEYFPNAPSVMSVHPDWCAYYMETRPF